MAEAATVVVVVETAIAVAVVATEATVVDATEIEAAEAATIATADPERIVPAKSPRRRLPSWKNRAERLRCPTSSRAATERATTT